MNKNNSQVVNTLLIVIGSALLIFELVNENENVYLLILGIVLLMFGLYRATNHWVYTKDDHKDDEDSTLKKDE